MEIEPAIIAPSFRSPAESVFIQSFLQCFDTVVDDTKGILPVEDNDAGHILCYKLLCNGRLSVLSSVCPVDRQRQ